MIPFRPSSAATAAARMPIAGAALRTSLPALLDGGGAVVGTLDMSDLFQGGAAEQARRLEQQDDNEQRKHVNIAQLGRNVERPELFDERDKEPARDRAANIAD